MLARLNRGPNEPLIGLPGSRSELGTPALVLDLDVLDANIASLAAHARTHGYALRPVAKVHKSVDIARAADRGRRHRRVLRDAGRGGGDGRRRHPRRDALHLGRHRPKLERLAALNARADGPDRRRRRSGQRRAARRGRAALGAAAAGARRHRGRRSPHRPRRRGARGRARAARSRDADGLDYAGLQGYVGDHQNTVDYDARRARSHELLAPLVAPRRAAAAPRASPRASSRAAARARTTSTTSSACSPSCSPAPTRSWT